MTRREVIDHANSCHGAPSLTNHNTYFANISNGAQRVWRLDIPVLKVSGDGAEEINLLLCDDDSNELHLLRVLTEYLRRQQADLGIRPENECIALQLATDELKLFQNVRPTNSGVKFSQFKVWSCVVGTCERRGN